MTHTTGWKRGRYVGVKFTSAQRGARRRWRNAQELESALYDGLRVITRGQSREELHRVLDRRLDHIEKLRRLAREEFPQVDESFTVASFEMHLG